MVSIRSQSSHSTNEKGRYPSALAFTSDKGRYSLVRNQREGSILAELALTNE